MNEWRDTVNPFNSDKILMYREHLEGAATGNYLPPIMAAIDPSARCNLKCKWCIANKCIDNTSKFLPAQHYIDIARFIKEWGVKSNCIAGGGEPFCNREGTLALIDECYVLGISNSVTTNGTLLNDDLIIDTLARKCRWVGISVDAGDGKTFAKVKGCEESVFDKVLHSIFRLRKKVDELQSGCEIGFKFLLHPDNALEIQEACAIARENGAHHFHLRPFTITTTDTRDRKRLIEMRKDINKQIEACLNYTSDTFKVYAVRHKYNFDFKPKFPFIKCRSAFNPVFMANGDFSLCSDRRGDSAVMLCKHYPDLKEIKKLWGGERHKQLLNAVKFSDCPKCNASKCNEIIEKAFMQDKMCRLHI